MRRRLTAWLLILAMLLALTGCGSILNTAAGALSDEAEQLSQALTDNITDTPAPADEADPTEQTDAAPDAEAAASAEASAAPEDASENDGAEASPVLDENGSYSSKDDVALYIHTYGHLPDNFITKKDAQALGWEGGSLEPYAPGKCIGGSHFGNYEGILPEKEGRSYTECDIDTLGASKRGAKRIVFSNDGLIYYTEDHYQSFELLYGEGN